ncbi:BTB/POZ domain-containing protein [Aspergillus homomorphus CBS 101889]|uniref:BTB domain-containing protein n=1 Tax=Aspergillus homomorphus (strain CBS 101889) TaxID=1450537 RepID=A0A395HKK3_ASPHC|nr:hypothetical protein BO97DRAFT_428298 [Aspergillus homomorphus CBS 101889]RAL08472.1 hypothetical protein BO97DRAFT_428298 [Aspergillus homomorphus CBS 101889]
MNKLAAMLRNARQGELCDLRLECEGVQLTVHKIVVCNESEMIKTACSANFLEKRTNVVRMEDFSLATVKRMVEYMYIGDYGLGCGEKWVSELAHSTSDTIPASTATSAPETSFMDTSFAGPGPDSAELTQPTTADILRPHIQMSMIAGYYVIPGLQDLALEKIKQASEQTWSPAGFDEMVKEVYGSLTHQATQNHLAEMAIKHLHDLHRNEALFPDVFSRRVISTMLLQLANALEQASEAGIQANAEQIRASHAEQRFKRLRANLEGIRNIRKCRHCDQTFDSYFELANEESPTCKLRCRACNTRHICPQP